MAFNKLNKDIGAKRKVRRGWWWWSRARGGARACRAHPPASAHPPLQAGENTDALQAQSKAMKDEIMDAEKASDEADRARDAALAKIGNLVHASVPVSRDEADNVTVRTWGAAGAAPGKGHNHVALVQLLDIADVDAGAAVAGSRGYFLKREGVLLNQALIQAALAAGVAAGATPVQTPFFMVQSSMAAVAQLAQFDEELYKVTGEGEDKYLIATSEQPLCAMHRNKW